MLWPRRALFAVIEINLSVKYTNAHKCVCLYNNINNYLITTG